MRHDIKILIAGGDMRQAHCAARLARKYKVTLAGFDSSALPDDIQHLTETPDTAGEFDFAVLPMHGLNSGGNITAPHYSAVLAAEDIAAAVKDGGTVYTGIADARLAELFPRHRLVSYMEREELLLKNAVLTAEGAVQLALGRLDTALCGLPVLIVGLGRIGTSLAMILRGFGADVTAAVRSPQAAAKAEMLGVKSVYTNDLSDSYALVFNTSPETVFTRGNLGIPHRNALFIELASGEGGFSRGAADMLGEHIIRAGGLPAKKAPVTAGEIVADAVSALIEEGGGNCGD